jgi:hypothetical protein
MSHLACPTCRQVVPDSALDAGECPFCGYDGAMIAAANHHQTWLIATLAVVLCGAALGAYLLIPRPEPMRTRGLETAASRSAASPPSKQLPPEPERAPPPRFVLPKSPPVLPSVAAPPKKNVPAPAVVGPVQRIDPRAIREKRIDAPEGAVAISDMSGDDHLILRGSVRQLRVGSVGGRAMLDASGLAAEEIIITGDIHGRAAVKLHAPDGTVTISGHVEGTARVVVDAPRGEIILSAGSGKLDGEAQLSIIARSVAVRGVLGGNARLFVTLTGGGSVESGPVQENASVIFVPAGQQ